MSAEIDYDAVSFITSSSYREQVITRLADGAATPSEIADDTGIKLPHVSRALSRLRQRDYADLLVSEDTRKGRYYGLTAKGEGVIEDTIKLRGD